MSDLLKTYIPKQTGVYRYERRDIGGLDRRDAPDSESMSTAVNILPELDGAVRSADGIDSTGKTYASPVSLHSLGDALLVLHLGDDGLYATYVKNTLEITAKVSDDTSNAAHRSVVRFNKYSNPADPLSGTYERYVLIYPDKMIFDKDKADAGSLEFEAMDGETIVTPKMDHVCVFLSRLFGTDNDRVYASGFNDFRDFELDTVTDTSSANAWATTAQSNARSDGAFTATAVYDGHVICFKRDFCHIINNNKNPFRIADLMTVGCVSEQTLAELDGVLYFAGERGIYTFGGGSPHCISEQLGSVFYDGSVAAAYKGKYYIYVPLMREIYVYDPKLVRFGTIAVSDGIVSITEHRGRLYMLMESGVLAVLESGLSTEFEMETSLILGGASDPRRIKRMLISVTLGEGGRIDGYIIEGGGDRKKIFSKQRAGTHTIRTRLRGYAADGHRLAFSGVGDAVIHGISLEYADAN